MTLIQDQFTALEGKVSKQRIWQLRQKAMGRCKRCPRPIVKGSSEYCFTHHRRKRVCERIRQGWKPRYISGLGRKPTV